VVEAVAPEAGAKLGERAPAMPFRWRVPTQIVVAVLGLVLGSWLLPAFTRQWDDRQKAGEVKATIIAQIASATGGALLDAHQASITSPGAASSAAAIPAAGKQWAIANMEIRARLQAYFGPQAVDRWALVSQYVTSALSVAYGGPAGDAVIPNPWVSRAKSPHLELMFRKFLVGENVFEALEIAILSENEGLMTGLLEMHVQGYSTTLRDFANDLFPVVG
jgi:hypothetical protein